VNVKEGKFGRYDAGTPLNVLLGHVRVISSLFGCVVVGVVLSVALAKSRTDALCERWWKAGVQFCSCNSQCFSEIMSGSCRRRVWDRQPEFYFRKCLYVTTEKC
jgi:hypothetical protein